MIYVIIRSTGDYDSYRTTPTAYYLSLQDAQDAAYLGNAFIVAARLHRADLDDLDNAIKYGDDDGSNTSWDNHIASVGGLPGCDQNLTNDSFGVYGVNRYDVQAVPAGKVSRNV